MRILLLALVAALIFPANTFALGVQDDESLKQDPSAYLARADAMGADRIRLTVPDNRWEHEADSYIQAARAAHEDGKSVTVSLMAWRSTPTPRQWRAYTLEVVRHMAPYVDVWSPMNEPNFDLMAPYSPNVHGPHDLSDSAREREMRLRGRAYRRIWDKTAPIIRLLDPRAKLVVGDQAPSDTNGIFMKAFYRSGKLRIKPDILGVHPYSFLAPWAKPYSRSWNLPGIKRAVRFAKRHSLKTWVTEWGYGPKQPASWWPQAMRKMQRAGVQQIFIYDTAGGMWNTKAPDKALEGIANR